MAVACCAIVCCVAVYRVLLLGLDCRMFEICCCLLVVAGVCGVPCIVCFGCGCGLFGIVCYNELSVVDV